MTEDSPVISRPAAPSARLVGIAFGVAAAACWAASFVAARHGVKVGFTPADLVLYRFITPGLLFLPLMLRDGLFDLGGVGWGRGIALAIFGGPAQALLAYTGFTLVPLGHGVVIQPACATLGGMLLAAILLREYLSVQRILGAFLIVLGLITFGAEALTAFGHGGVAGDLLFVSAGSFWAIFSILLRRWSLGGVRAVSAVSVVALVLYTPVHALISGYQHMLAASLWENLLQFFVQGLLAAAVPIYLYARSIMLLGAGRASSVVALVPCFGLVFGALTIGEWPSLPQLAGLGIVILGFHFTQKA
jgi:drug/metabolite transporter (DMT)-like permease